MISGHLSDPEVFMKSTLTILLIAATACLAQQRGNGDRVDSFPQFNERQLLVLTNACRMAPVEYRDLYIGNYQVLLPANYPAIKPLYWNLGLNKASHAHAIDMADNCGMQHPSCDGTTWNARIKSYYTKSSSIAENIAAGNTTALATIKQWVLEVNPAQSPVPADLSSGDGHRKNIMGASYKELGTGYAKGPQQYTYFWVHDFGGGKPDFTNPLVAGCHFFIETGKTTFFVNCFDSVAAPANVSCVIENQVIPMTLALGTINRGTYTLVQTKGAACRRYYFTCAKSGTTFRYPEYGTLVTSGEGTCATDYTPPESLSVRLAGPGKMQKALTCSYLGDNSIYLSNLPESWISAVITIVDLHGRVLSIYRLFSKHRTSGSLLLPFTSKTRSAVFIVRAAFDGKEIWTGKMVVRRRFRSF
jgi:hypothetical protein